ncbi:uncharacterized protein LOC114132788 isoform X2 [Aphis gossypii]|nr:uncharacterized protein LOC114132788 isoform X2 [Aphis gossypii]XP_027854164.2 uncharacterized protein LOC114132788 isoform X2 [Aphis gossypii]XP_050061514.1 uncharacterized protein LOC114132788 isoform X2 [Aphis gossypii]CAH1732719.1 unnamed protein product [Aphis gossypii]
MPVDRLDQLTNFTPESSSSYNPTVVDHSTNLGILEKIDVKKLLDALKILSEEKSAGVSKTTSLPSTVQNAVHELDYSKDKVDEDLTKNQVTGLVFLNTAYAKVSDHIKSVNENIQKNYDILMKLNILKGMLMEDNIRSRGLTPWIKYMSKYKNIDNSYY